MADESKYSATTGATYTNGYQTDGQEIASADHARKLTGLAWRGDDPFGSGTNVQVRVWTQSAARENGVAEVYAVLNATKLLGQTVNGITGCVVVSGLDFTLEADQRYLVAVQWYSQDYSAFLGMYFYSYDSGDFASDEDAFIATAQAAWNGTVQGWLDAAVFVVVHLASVTSEIPKANGRFGVAGRFARVLR
jgi:hypothetical protein